MKLNVKAFALTCAIFWSVSVFIITWWLIAFYGAVGSRTILGLFYLGYSVSPLGSIIGLIWGFVDGLISGAIFALLYNFLVERFRPA